MEYQLITAHSGCEDTLCDSMDSVDRAIVLGADVAEVDVRCSFDGILYISHDRAEGAELLEKLTLEDVFSRIKDTQICINCDLKEPDILSAVLDTADKCRLPAERLFLSGSVNPLQLQAEPTIVERAKVLLNIEEVFRVLHREEESVSRENTRFSWEYIAETIEKKHYEPLLAAYIKSLNVCGVNLPYRIISPTLLEAFADKDIPLSIWTVNDEEDIYACIDMGAANVTTLSVQTAVKCRERSSAL